MNLIQKSLEIFGALGVAHGEQAMPGGQTQRAEHDAPRIAATDAHFGGLPAPRPTGVQRRKQQQIRLILEQHHMSFA
jgi:hypothetical protein